MDTYAKLFSKIITSSIWSEDDKTRIMWVTMLALKDSRGHVDGAIPGMAAVARMSLADAEKAIAKLEGPDPYSRTPDHDGRRIVKEPGGWRVVNHALYREIRDPEKRREQTREAVRRYRAKGNNDVSQCKPEVSRGKPGEADTYTYTDIRGNAAHSVKSQSDLHDVRESASPCEEPEFHDPPESDALTSAHGPESEDPGPDPDVPSTPEERHFEQARRLYPGRKRGFRVEFTNFRRRHPDWRDLLDDDGLAQCVQVLIDRKAYSPGYWPHFQTFTNQSRYEEALQPPEAKR